MAVHEAVFMNAACGKTKKPFALRFDVGADGKWVLTYGLSSAPSGTGSGKIRKVDLTNFRFGPQYKCSHCRQDGLVECSCGRGLSCKSSRSADFVCGHCGKNGTVDGTIESLDGKSGRGQ